MDDDHEPPLMPAAEVLGLSQLGPEALEDTHLAAYALLVVAPVCMLASRMLLRRGKATSYLHVLLVSFVVPALLIGVPVWLKWRFSDPNVYRMLRMERTETRYVWGQKYAYLRSLHQTGQIPAHVWHQIDAAYDQIYDETRRMLYDIWGPVGAKMSRTESQLNVALFYVLWTGILFVLTTPTRTRDASKWVSTALLALLFFELAIKVVHYEPPLCALFSTTTPHEFVVWAHRLFPIAAFAAVSTKRVLFIDMEKHRARQLAHMLAQNEVTKRELAALEQSLLGDGDDDDDAPAIDDTSEQ